VVLLVVIKPKSNRNAGEIENCKVKPVTSIGMLRDWKFSFIELAETWKKLHRIIEAKNNLKSGGI
jgi:hypothetical protein